MTEAGAGGEARPRPPAGPADDLDRSVRVSPEQTLEEADRDRGSAADGALERGIEADDPRDSGGDDAPRQIAGDDASTLPSEAGLGPGAGEAGDAVVERRAVPAEEAPTHPSLRPGEKR